MRMPTKVILIIFIIFSIIVTVGHGYGENYGGSSGGSSSSGGSRGGMTTSNIDPYSNIVKHEVVERDLMVNQSVEYSLTSPEFSIYQILINGKENEYDVSVRIEGLINTSKYAKPAPGIVYINENVGLGSVKINYISVRFRVKNSWIKDNGLENGRLPYLLKWNGSLWSVLKTNITGKDDNYTYFESPKAGNSRIGIFAISAPLRRINNDTSATIVPPEEEYEEIVPDIEEKETQVNVFNRLPGFVIIVIIAGIIILLIYINKKRYLQEK